MEGLEKYSELQTAVEEGRTAARRSWVETQGPCMLAPLVYGRLEFTLIFWSVGDVFQPTLNPRLLHPGIVRL
ncbi:hypothetical protein Y032_0091g2488 [Ancylostoma ceylanicum]|uniref:Uncharacterized protein n=1 Tax=Ancylostoma ceylanicum TaxID=53326 RepID=A0A016TME8_9BILA|nr:hypothetical protein Y032_0091g2488 [Ancylostoma ceylanicum]